jgi:hypothetical protein
MSGYTIKMEELSYDISLAAPEVKLALSRTGGQGSKGDSITSAATVNGELILTVTRADGTTFEINAGAGTSGTSGTPALGEVTDVTLGTLATGEVLQYNGSAWVNTGLNFTDIAGTLADAQVVQSNVTQHQAALNITESQISDLGSYQTADATILKSADIGISVQGFDANLVSDATYVKTDENFTTADHTKLDGIEESATADQTGSEIKALYEAETNAFTDALFTKLAGIEENATADQLSLVEVCKNVSGTTLAAGTVVYQSGTSGNAMEVQAADPTNAAKMPAIGVISSDLVNEAEGEIVLVGFIQAMDTSSFSEGETLYVGATGGLQNTTPTGEGSLIQNIGKVIKVHASNGSVMVTGAGRANAAPNLNDGNIFIGDATNTASTGSLDTLVGNAGYIKDYTPTEAEVTAHQAALSITESQISDFGSYEVADATILKGADIGVNVQAYDANLVSDATYVKTDENFTTADHTKLDGIEAAADVTDTTNVVAALTAGSNITISAGGEIASTDTNTTYVSSDFTHDDLTGFEANEHIDWTINSGSTIHSGNLPAIAITSVQTAADQTAHLALTAQEGDIVVRSDENKSYVHNGGTAGTMADYTLLATPTDTVLSVNGSTGAVTLTHDGFSDYVANEHIDWTADQGATNIHANNYTDTDTTYTADGDYGMTLSGTAFRLEDDRRRNSDTVDVYSGNTHDYTFYDASTGIRWYTAGAEEMRLENDGDLHVDGNITAYSATVSDERLKHDIEPITGALDKVNAIGGYTFTYNKEERKSAGVIAQEVQKVLPSAVTSGELPFHGEEGEEYLTVQYDQIIGLLIESIKELNDKVEKLEGAK